MRWMTRRRCRTWVVVALFATGAQVLGPGAIGSRMAYGHGGGGGHMGGFGGGGHMGGFGGGGMGGYRGAPMSGFDGGMSRGGFGGPQDFGGARFDGGRGFDGGRPIDTGRGFDEGRPIDAGRGFDGGRPIDTGRPIDGGRALDGARFDGGRPLDGGARFDGLRDDGVGHFAGAGELSRADFQRIAAGDIGRDGFGRDGVRPYSMNQLADRGAAVRRNIQNRDWYANRAWYDNHFNAWWPGAWWGGFGWGMGMGMFAGLAWGDLARWGGYGAMPVAYDYGTTVQYQNDGVYVQGALVGTPEEYAAQAATLAASGGPDVPVAADDQWRSLGVFAMTRAQESDPTAFVSLAIDQAGLLRGTYYDAVSDATQKVTGKVDKKSQRAAWTIGDRSTPVYDAGLANLTKDQTTVLVHRDGGKVEQMLLVRVPAPKQGGAAAAGADGTGAAPTP